MPFESAFQYQRFAAVTSSCLIRSDSEELYTRLRPVGSFVMGSRTGTVLNLGSTSVSAFVLPDAERYLSTRENFSMRRAALLDVNFLACPKLMVGSSGTYPSAVSSFFASVFVPLDSFIVPSSCGTFQRYTPGFIIVTFTISLPWPSAGSSYTPEPSVFALAYVITFLSWSSDTLRARSTTSLLRREIADGVNELRPNPHVLASLSISTS